MSSIHRRSGLVKAAVAAPVLALALAACGGSSSGGTASSTPAATSSGQAGQRGAFGAQFQAIQQCLTAAGIAVPTPRVRPSGSNGVPPSGGFNGTPPAGANGTPGPRPSGGNFRGGQGGMGTILNSAKAKAALKACGITVPTGQFRRPTPTATATS